MKDEANIVKQYADSDVGERINILIKHYPNFIRLVEGYEQSLGFIIKQEKECRRRSWDIRISRRQWTFTPTAPRTKRRKSSRLSKTRYLSGKSS